jgi:undecaprenyl-diphosphatase
LSVTAFALSILIGFSRLFLGVHYLTDVVGGWVAGLVWLIICVLINEVTAASRSKSPENLERQTAPTSK